MHLYTFPVFLLLLCAAQQGECSTAAQREETLHHVMASASPLVRPDGEEGEGSPVKVNISFQIIQLLDMDLADMRAKASGYLYLSWVDPRLSFSDANVTDIRVDASDIWTPDIELYKSDEPVQMMNQRNLAIISSSGLVTLVPQVALVSRCSKSGAVSLTCDLEFGSWTYNGNQLDLVVPPEIGLEAYIQDHRWRVYSGEVHRIAEYYTCCPEPYVSARFSFQLVRSFAQG